MSKILLVIALLFSSLSIGQIGSIDLSFNTMDDGTFGNGSGVSGSVYAFGIHSDNSMVLGGSFTQYNGVSVSNIVKVNSDGSMDIGFVSGTGFDAEVSDVLIQSDGKIIVVGYFTNYNGSPVNRVVRLNVNGSIDPTFLIGTGANNIVNAIDTNSIGQIYLAGRFTNFNGIIAQNIIRLNQNGAHDPAFQNNYSFGNYLSTLMVQSNDQVWIGGLYSNYAGSGLNGAVRLNTNGTLDASFDAQLGINSNVYGFHEAAGNIYISGNLDGAGGVSNIDDIARFSLTGVFDPSFDVGLQNIRKCVEHAGFVYTVGYSNYLYKCDLSGNILETQPHVSSGFDVQIKNNVLFTGSSDGMFKVEPTDLSLFHHYNYGGGPATHDPAYPAGISLTHLYPGNSMLVVGSFDHFNTFASRNLCKLFADGTVDPSFVSALDLDDNQIVKDISVDNNGKIYVAGQFDIGQTPYNIARLNPDGSLDISFSPIFFPSQTADEVEIMANGKLVYTLRANILGVQTTNIYRLNTNGSIDPTFVFSTPIEDGFVKEMVVRSDGKIFLGRSQDDFQGNSGNGLLAFNANGTPDVTFNTSHYSQFAHALILDDSDNLYVGGHMWGESDVLTKFLPNGTIDASYQNANIQSTIHEIAIQNDGKLLVSQTSGSVTSIKRVNTDGTFDQIIGSSLSGYINHINVDENNQLIVAGNFDYFSQYQKNTLTRLVNDIIFDPCFYLDVPTTSVSPINCTNPGSIEVAANYGTAPYVYSWQPIPSGNVDSIGVLQTGYNTVTVTDALGCIDSTMIFMQAPISSAQYDLSPYLVATNFRPGFPTNMWIEGVNSSCTPADGFIEMILPTSLVSFTSATPSPTYFNGDTLRWDFSNLYFDNSSFSISMEVMTLVSASVGDTVNIGLSMSPNINDANPSDNVKDYSYQVLNGYDPNDKAVYPIGTCIPHYVLNDEQLTYTVRFQNTGNSEAYNIYLLDSISSFLDLNSLNLVSSSDDVIIEQLPGRVLKFRFDNIMLPDNTSNPDGSHGYVIFQLTPEAGVNFGDLVENEVNIYFDYNPPILTNTVFNTISDVTMGPDFSQITLTGCDSIQWNNTFYSNSGVYTTTQVNQFGCDSTATLNLTLGAPDTTNVTETGIDLITINGIDYTSTGTYYQNLTNSFGCDSLLILDLTIGYTGIENFLKEDIQVFPNPAEDNLTIQLPELSGETHLQLINSNGQILVDQRNQNQMTIQLDLTQTNPGFYYLILQNSGNQFVIKVNIE